MTPSERDEKNRLQIKEFVYLNNEDKESDIQIDPIVIENTNQSQCCRLEDDYTKDNCLDSTMSFSTDIDRNGHLSKSMFQENIHQNYTDELQYKLCS